MINLFNPLNNASQRRSKAIRCAFSCLAFAASSAFAAPEQDELPKQTNGIASGVRDAKTVERLRDLDRKAQLVKEKSLDIDHAVQAFVEELSGVNNPSRAFITVDHPNGFHIQSLRLDVNGNTVSRQEFSPEESTSFSNGGAIRAFDQPLSPGEHQLTVAITGKTSLDNSTQNWSNSRSIAFETDQFATHIQLSVFAEGRKNRDSNMSLSVLSENQAKEIGELYRREALHLQNLGKPMLAATTLQRAADKGFVNANADEANFQLGKIYAQYGLHYLASARFHKLTDRPQPFNIGNEAWLRLADQQFRRGQLGLTGLVEYSASRVRQPMSDDQQQRRTNLLGQLYLAQSRYLDAASVLKDQTGSRLLRDYAEYNRGISLINVGEVDHGVAKLDSLGKRRTRSEEAKALKDLANLSLAYYFLEHEDAGSAIPLLKRIRTEGSFSNKALLALGWAELGESGRVHGNAELIAAQCADNSLKSLGSSPSNLRAAHRQDSCAAQGSFKRELTAETDPARFRAALKSWLQVRDRNPIHPAVQETLLAIPFGLLRKDQPELARQHYRYALDVFEFEATRIDHALDAVHNEEFITLTASAKEQEWAGNDWRVNDISPNGTPDLRLIYRLIARHDFYEVLVNYRNLAKIKLMLEERQSQLNGLLDAAYQADNFEPDQAAADTTIGPGWRSFADTYNLPPVKRREKLQRRVVKLSKQVDSALKKHSDYLHEQAYNELLVQRQRIQVYSARARIALARIFDDMLKPIENR